MSIGAEKYQSRRKGKHPSPSRSIHFRNEDNLQVHQEGNLIAPYALLILESKEMFHPATGTLFVGKNDLITDPVENDIVFHTNGTAKLKVLPNEQWEDAFRRILAGELYGGIHLRSNAAQAQFDIVKWEFSELSEDPKGTMIVTLKNFSTQTAIIPRGSEFKIGNPYCYQSPLEGDELEKVAKGIEYLSEETAAPPSLLRKTKREAVHFIGDSEENKRFDTLILPLTLAHQNKVLYGNIDLTRLPSGPHRKPLHEKIAIDTNGMLISNLELSPPQHVPLIQLTSPPLFSMPPGTALISESCVKVVGDGYYLVQFSASKGHFPVAIASGTGNPEGRIYQHRYIAESLNTEKKLSKTYPTLLICRVFNQVVV